MKYLIIILIVVAVAGFLLSRQRNANEGDAGLAQEKYVCDQCGENFCDCHKKRSLT